MAMPDVAARPLGLDEPGIYRVTWVEALATIQADVQATSAAHAAWKVAQTVGVGAEFVAAERVR